MVVVVVEVVVGVGMWLFVGYCCCSFVFVFLQVLQPLQDHGNLAERIFSENGYSQFQLALFVSDMVNQLRQSGQGYTVLAPTDTAFSRLPSQLLDKILTDADTAESELLSVGQIPH